VQAIFSKVTSHNLKYACLFINKLDLIKNASDETIKSIEALYKKLWTHIYSAAPDCEFDLIVGSADKGIGTTQVLKRLVELSSPPGPGS
jgi:hypothetical protein